MQSWWVNHATFLPVTTTEDKARIEYLTGCVPLYLRELQGGRFFGKQFDHIEEDFLETPELIRAVRTSAEYFMMMDSKFRDDRQKWDRLVDV